MPELPEVETIRRSLEPKLIGQTVRAVLLRRRDIVVAAGDPFGGFARQRGPADGRAEPRALDHADLLQGATVIALRRLGKQLALIGAPSDESNPHQLALTIQLGMSGQLIHCSADEPIPDPRHTHAEWALDNGRLLFRDPRRFGGLRTFCSVEALDEHWRALGPDALTLSRPQLARGLAHSDRAVKAALLDQSVVAGIGNIYADEALFDAGIRPRRLCAKLSPADIVALTRSIRKVLRSSIRCGGSTLRDYVDGRGRRGSYQLTHAVYGRTGEPCIRCGRCLTTAQVAQRTTVWCATCQA